MDSYLNLKRRHQTFVDAYLQCGNAAKALRDTGHQGADADRRAYEILQREDVQKALAERIEEAIAGAGVTNHRILTELAKIAFSDVSTVFDDKGHLKPISEWPDTTRAAIAGLEVEELNRPAFGGAAGEEVPARRTTRVVKFRLADKIRALEILAKYKKLLIDQVEFPAGIPLPPPIFNIGFRNGGPGATRTTRDPGAEGS